MNKHAGILNIDLAAIRKNWRYISNASLTSKASAVVKADSYGLGIEKIVPILIEEGCDVFFVAHISEGIITRKYAPDSQIYILNSFIEDVIEEYKKYNLSPVLGSIEEFLAWKKLNNALCKPAAIHIDTGMNRLGMNINEAFDIFYSLELSSLNIDLVMSHLVSAEIPGDKTTQKQIELFLKIQKELEKKNKEINLSLYNSSGIFLNDAPSFSLTRPGYALYGGNPTPYKSNPMQEVVRLEAPIIQIRNIENEESVGYNGRWVANKKSRIAIISCGYADGIPRSLSAPTKEAGGIAIIAGSECPFVGNVSMDLIAIDISEISENIVKVGDYATLIGGGLSIDRVGSLAKTTGYEILTSLGKRFDSKYTV